MFSVMIRALLSLQIKKTVPAFARKMMMPSPKLTTDKVSTADFRQIVLSWEGEVPSGQTLQVAPFPT